MNTLYITSNVKNVKNESKQYAQRNQLEWFAFKNTREDMNTIIDIYNNEDDCVIFLEGLTKSIVSNTLLKILEENNKNIHIHATTSTYDISPALKSRFVTIICTDSYLSSVANFFRTRRATKEEYSNLHFYIDIANYIVYNKINPKENMALINEIVKDIRLTTNNTPWDYYYEKLLEGIRW